MRSNCIYIKFASEAKYERLTFTSQVVTYNEIKHHLEKKKHIVFADKKTEKTDNIVLYDEINNREIAETERNIEANLHVIVLRTPQKNDAIELTYNPKLTGENTLGQQKLLENAAALKMLSLEPGAEAVLDEGQGQSHDDQQIEKQQIDQANPAVSVGASGSSNVIKFQTSKIDLSLLGQEFKCSMQKPGVGGAHIIEDPVILNCCGATCCLECSQQILGNQALYKSCPICRTNFSQKHVKVMHNLPLQRLLNQELIKLEQQLDPAQKEEREKEMARKLVEEKKRQMEMAQMVMKQVLGGVEGADGDEDDEEMVITTGADGQAADQEQQQIIMRKIDPLKQILQPGRKHPLIECIHPQTVTSDDAAAVQPNQVKILMFRAPTEDYFLHAVRTNTWCISQKCFERVQHSSSTVEGTFIGVVSIAGSNAIQGAFKFEKHPLVTEEADDDWLKVYSGPQKYQFTIQWLSLFGPTNISTSSKDGGVQSTTLSFQRLLTKGLTNPLRHRISSDVEPLLSAFKDGECLSFDVGSQLCSLIAEHEKQLMQQQLLMTRYRGEYFKAKKERFIKKQLKLSRQRAGSDASMSSSSESSATSGRSSRSGSADDKRVLENGLTRKENEMLNRYIKKEEETKQQMPVTYEEQIDQMQMMMYGDLATPEQILGKKKAMLRKKQLSPKKQSEKQKEEAKSSDTKQPAVAAKVETKPTVHQQQTFNVPQGAYPPQPFPGYVYPPGMNPYAFRPPGFIRPGFPQMMHIGAPQSFYQMGPHGMMIPAGAMPPGAVLIPQQQQQIVQQPIQEKPRPQQPSVSHGSSSRDGGSRSRHRDRSGRRSPPSSRDHHRRSSPPRSTGGGTSRRKSRSRDTHHRDERRRR